MVKRAWILFSSLWSLLMISLCMVEFFNRSGDIFDQAAGDSHIHGFANAGMLEFLLVLAILPWLFIPAANFVRHGHLLTKSK
jgi:hypothetical protein